MGTLVFFGKAGLRCEGGKEKPPGPLQGEGMRSRDWAWGSRNGWEVEAEGEEKADEKVPIRNSVRGRDAAETEGAVQEGDGLGPA